MLFTDVSWFCLTRGDGRIHVYRQRNERYPEACTLERDQFGGGGSVMVWGCVCQHHQTEFVVNAVRYREDILLPHAIPFLQVHPNMTLQQCNATSQTARSVHDFLQDRNVSVLPWPEKSPDLNPIKHIWDVLDRRVRASDQSTFFHMFGVSPRWLVANFNRHFLWISLRNGFLLATLP